MQALLIAVVCIGFVWLMFSVLSGAWQQEQAHKAQEAAWVAAHPEDRPSTTTRWLGLGVTVAGLGAVAWLTNVAGMNVGPACLIVAVPVLIARKIRQYRRAQSAANRSRFGDYTPTFRSRDSL